MITIGVDAHKQVHAAVAVDDAGRDVAQWRGPNTRASWDELHRWAVQLGDDRQWGVEGAGGYGRGLAQRLVDVGEAVFEVNSRWTASGRRSARKGEKTDALDATAVARTVRQEGSSLPRVHPDDESSILSVLTTERDELVRESNRIRNQIHHLLLQVDPEYKGQIGCLTTRSSLGALSRYAAPDRGALQEHRAAAVRRLAVRLELVKRHVDDVSLQIKDIATARFPALTRLCGVNALTAGILAGLLGPGQRFANDAQLAAYAGVAPLEASSGMRVRHRLSRSGNRRLNSVIYWIVLTQAHHSPEARTYLTRRMSQGKTRRRRIGPCVGTSPEPCGGSGSSVTARQSRCLCRRPPDETATQRKTDRNPKAVARSPYPNKETISTIALFQTPLAHRSVKWWANQNKRVMLVVQSSG